MANWINKLKTYISTYGNAVYGKSRYGQAKQGGGFMRNKVKN
jgi:hypothetical protein